MSDDVDGEGGAAAPGGDGFAGIPYATAGEGKTRKVKEVIDAEYRFAGKTTGAHPAAGQAPSRDDSGATVAAKELPGALWRAKAEGMAIIILLGLSATGKSFFAQRLDDVSMQHYEPGTMKGAISYHAPGDLIDSTKDFLFYRFNPLPGSPARAFALLDMPGELFRDWVRINYASDDAGAFASLSVALALADALLIAVPALQLLEQQHFLDHGDRLNRDLSARQARCRELEAFLRSLQSMRAACQPLRRAAGGHGDRRPLENRQAALDAAVGQAPGDRQGFDQRAPLSMPAFLMLTRGDELGGLYGSEARANFDRDPHLDLAEAKPAWYKQMASQFTRFGVDFVSPCAGALDTAFDPGKPHYGVDGLLEKWVFPSIDAARRAPGAGAIDDWALRCARDPAFARHFRKLP